METKNKLIKMRYQKVFDALKEDFVPKLILSSSVWIWTSLQNMFATNVELILLLMFAIIIDWFSGHVRARKQGIKIVSFGWRQTCVKIIEYAAFLFILTGVSNVFGETQIDNWVGSLLEVVGHIDYFGYFYLTITELKSIAENFSGKKGEFSQLIDFIEDKIGLDEFKKTD